MLPLLDTSGSAAPVGLSRLGWPRATLLKLLIAALRRLKLDGPIEATAILTRGAVAGGCLLGQPAYLAAYQFLAYSLH